MLAGERVDHDFAERGAISEIEEGASAMRLAVIMDFGRGVEAGRGERDARQVRAAAEIVEGAAPAVAGDALSGEGDIARFAAEDRGGKAGEPIADRGRGIVGGHAVQ